MTRSQTTTVPPIIYRLTPDPDQIKNSVNFKALLKTQK